MNRPNQTLRATPSGTAGTSGRTCAAYGALSSACPPTGNPLAITLGSELIAANPHVKIQGLRTRRAVDGHRSLEAGHGAIGPEMSGLRSAREEAVSENDIGPGGVPGLRARPILGSGVGAITGNLGAGYGVWAMLMRKVRRSR